MVRPLRVNQSGNLEVITVNDHILIMERTDDICDVKIYSVIDGVFHASYQDDKVCIAFVVVCCANRNDERFITYCSIKNKEGCINVITLLYARMQRM